MSVLVPCVLHLEELPLQALKEVAPMAQRLRELEASVSSCIFFWRAHEIQSCFFADMESWWGGAKKLMHNFRKPCRIEDSVTSAVAVAKVLFCFEMPCDMLLLSVAGLAKRIIGRTAVAIVVIVVVSSHPLSSFSS